MDLLFVILEIAIIKKETAKILIMIIVKVTGLNVKDSGTSLYLFSEK